MKKSLFIFLSLCMLAFTFSTQTYAQGTRVLKLIPSDHWQVKLVENSTKQAKRIYITFLKQEAKDLEIKCYSLNPASSKKEEIFNYQAAHVKMNDKPFFSADLSDIEKDIEVVFTWSENSKSSRLKEAFLLDKIDD